MATTLTGWVRAYRLAFALLALGTIAHLFLQGPGRADFRPFNFLSFFTIQSNLFAALVLLYGALGGSSGDREQRSVATIDLIRGAAVLYLTITGVVYAALLSGYQEGPPTAMSWVDTVLHRVMPLVMVADWLIVPPRAPIALRRALVWLAYPLLFAVYSLVRGPLVGWYPYPFLDPASAGGYGGVALYCLGVAGGALVFAWLIVLTGRRMVRSGVR